MAKITAPLLSQDASGSVGGTLVFSKWKGRNYVRSLVTPANPKSVKQVGTRAMMKFLAQNWAAISAADKATWATLGAALDASGFNGYVSHNMDRWTQFTAPGQAYPVAGDDAVGAGVSFALVGGVKQVTININVPVTINQNWGVLIFRNPTGTFTPSRDNCKAAVLKTAIGITSYIDTNLAAGTYFYDIKLFSKHGVLGADVGEQSVTI